MRAPAHRGPAPGVASTGVAIENRSVASTSSATSDARGMGACG